MTVEYLIAGERAALGALRRDLADTYARWMNRLEVRTGLMNLGILDAEAEGEWLAEAAKQNAEMRPTQANFTIYDRRDGEAVGTSALMNVDYAHGRARFGILLGERRGQGLGTEAKLAGRRRDALLLHGRRWDEISMDAVADEFTGSVLSGRIPAAE